LRVYYLTIPQSLRDSSLYTREPFVLVLNSPTNSNLTITKGLFRLKFYDFKKLPSILVPTFFILLTWKIIQSGGKILDMILSFFKTLSPVILAFIIAALIYPLCAKAEKTIAKVSVPFIKKRARTFSVLGVYLGLIALICAFVFLVFPPLFSSLSDFAEKIPSITESLVEKINSTPFLSINEDKLFQLGNRILDETVLSKLNTYTTGIVKISGRLIDTVLAVVASVYILLDRKNLKHIACAVLIFVFGKDRTKKAKKYIRTFTDISYKYLYSILIDAMIVFSLSLAILLILKIKYSVILALILGLFNIIPYFGAVCGFAIATGITLITASPAKALTLAIAILLVQQADSALIQPRIIKNNLSLKPFWVLSGVLVGGELFGIYGILATVPVLAFIKCLFDNALEKYSPNNQH